VDALAERAVNFIREREDEFINAFFMKRWKISWEELGTHSWCLW
jgi:hypothetical protein